MTEEKVPRNDGRKSALQWQLYVCGSHLSESTQGIARLVNSH